MAHIPCPHMARFAVTFTHSVEVIKCEMTFGLVDTTDAMFVAPATTAASIWSAVTAHLVPAAVAQVIFNGIVWEDVRTVPYGGADYPQTPTAGTQSATGAYVPTDSTLAIKRLTATLGRSGRGRLYWPIWNAGEFVGPDEVGSAVAALITSGLAAFQTAVEMSLSPAQLCIISTQHAGVARTNGVAEPILGWSATDLLIDSQRRRLAGRGR